MEMDPTNGQILQFMSIDWYLGNNSTFPNYSTQSGVFLDKNDPFNRKPYIYMSFIMDKQIQMMRFLNEG
jgi:hypothetical protein